MSRNFSFAFIFFAVLAGAVILPEFSTGASVSLVPGSVGETQVEYVSVGGQALRDLFEGLTAEQRFSDLLKYREIQIGSDATVAQPRCNAAGAEALPGIEKVSYSPSPAHQGGSCYGHYMGPFVFPCVFVGGELCYYAFYGSNPEAEYENGYRPVAYTCEDNCLTEEACWNY